jgi:hypothetical protein
MLIACASEWIQTEHLVDEVRVVGNGLGNTRSENSGNRMRSRIADPGLTSENADQPQAPAKAGATS